MSMTTLTTVNDAGAAELVEGALRELGLTVELRRRRGDRYFGALVDESYEVRVPAAELREAREVLRALEREAALALGDRTGAFSEAAPEAEDEGDGEAAPRRRYNKAVRFGAPAVLTIFGALILGSLYRHGCQFSPPPGARSPRASPRTDSFVADDGAPHLREDVRDAVQFGAACAPQLVCLPSRR